MSGLVAQRITLSPLAGRRASKSIPAQHRALDGFAGNTVRTAIARDSRFPARPYGVDICKIHAGSLRSEAYPDARVVEAREMVNRALAS